MRVRKSPPILVACFPKAHLMSYSRLLPCNAARLHGTSLPRQIGQRQTFQYTSLWQNRYLYVKLKASHTRPATSKLAVEQLRLHAAKARMSDISNSQPVVTSAPGLSGMCNLYDLGSVLVHGRGTRGCDQSRGCARRSACCTRPKICRWGVRDPEITKLLRESFAEICM